jgi:mono/diheme cytochrome c family protein
MKSVAWKLAAGVVVSIALGSIACATGGSRSTGATDAATPAESAQAQAPPPAAPTAAPAPAPAKPSEPAVAAPAAPSAPPAAASDSPVAGYLADPQAMTRASGLFRAVCTGYCHTTQQAAARDAPNLFDCTWTHGSSDEEIFDTIAAGVPDTQMQAFGERLPHEDLWKLVAYLRQKSTCK